MVHAWSRGTGFTLLGTAVHHGPEAHYFGIEHADSRFALHFDFLPVPLCQFSLDVILPSMLSFYSRPFDLS